MVIFWGGLLVMRALAWVMEECRATEVYVRSEPTAYTYPAKVERDGKSVEQEKEEKEMDNLRYGDGA